ncbi:MAG: hypothetical protein M3O70_02210 [Actinomycetota bacterium]|nr:hypothetical protein [Actinomycetota bacterium]
MEPREGASGLMPSRWAARVALVLLVGMLLLVAGAFWIERFKPSVGQALSEQVGLQLSFVACGVLGALLAARRPTNRVGWAFLAIGVIAGLTSFSIQYAHYGLLTRPGSLPLAGVAAWSQTWTWFALMGGFFYIILVFPDGRPPSPRWRVVTALLAVGMASLAVVEHLKEEWHIGQTEWGLVVPNPFGPRVDDDVVATLEAVAGGIASVAMVLALVSLVVRYRRATGPQRTQLKWVMYGTVVAVIAITAVDTLPLPAAVKDLSAALLAILPATAAIAVLRYRLYDLDRLIGLTVTYAVVVAILAGLYGAGVVGIVRVVVALTGESPGDLVVATSTLAVAAAFRPLTRRVQSTVERHFYRSRYNANRIVADFTTRLRNPVDLDALATDLGRVTVTTMRPTSITLWWAPRQQQQT